ncbi:MAG: hypothetical protein JO362_02055 [Streptomycetaceae bacterium]|nr:hypothetical protein [Streptomycetaceae bacterium]
MTAAALAGAALLGLGTAPAAQAADSWTVYTARTTHCTASLRAKFDGHNWAQATGTNLSDSSTP